MAKVIAHSNTEVYRWKVIVEVGPDDIRELIRPSHNDAYPPQIGTEIDMPGLIRRLKVLESRENDLRIFGKLLAGFLPQPETPAAPEEH